MFYRKYRPQKFSEVSKPNDVPMAILSQVVAKKTSHAYLFIGPRGCGKTTTARLLAKALNCKKPAKNGDVCNECSPCKEISDGKFLDLIEIDAASNRGIDDIRTLKENINLSSFSSKYKIYIIDEVHMLTMEAFNALLKTLEEPPKHVVFILCTTEGHKVPETIKSRCQVFKFKRASVYELVVRLEELAQKEKFEIKKADLEKIAVASFGGFRDADTMLQQVIEGSLSVDALLGAGTIETFVKLTSFVIEGKAQSAMGLVSDVFSEGVDLTSWTGEYLRYLRDLLYIQAGFAKGVRDVPEDVYAKMEEQAFKLSSKELVFIIERFLRASGEIKTASIQELPLEISVVEVCEERIKEKGILEAEVAVEGEVEDAGKKDLSKGRTVSDSSGPLEESKAAKFNADDSAVSLTAITDLWGDILREVKPFNHSVEALLRSCKPRELKEHTLILEVFYAFHKERLESPKSREIIEKVLQEKFGTPLKVKCVLKSKEGASLTDKNVEEPKNKEVSKSALEVFNGGVDLNV
ncbi:MAG: DNA polymerase III subunit gamma/tau [Patescibacteria group bacterium]